MIRSGDILTQLKQHADELHRQFNVRTLAVFGSAARGELSDESDVDMLVEFEGAATFDRYMDLKFHLEDLLGRPVDLVTPNALKPRLRPVIEREAVRVA